MIEKIMKAVKSNNKKRGRNITIGAVVGLLLSCTSVMGADVVGLEITNDGTEIKFSKDTIPFDPNDPEDINNPYPENIWDEESSTYTNNSTISGTTSSDSAYGLKLSGDLGEMSFKNNGIVSGSGTSGYGITLGSRKIGTLENIGIISGTGSTGAMYTYGYGISSGSTIETITNKGLILGKEGNKTYGINTSNTINTIENMGLISGTGSSNSEGRGISISSSSTGIDSITNRGSILAKGTSVVFVIDNTYKKIGIMTNIGLISGEGGSSQGYGIYGADSLRITNKGSILEEGTGGSTFGISGLGNTSIANAGLISGRGNSSASGIGISQPMESVTNTGIIYGDKYGLDNTAYKNIDKAINYGIISGGNYGATMTVIDNPNSLGNQNLLNYGLIFKAPTSGYQNSTGDNTKHNFGKTNDVTIDEVAYTIRNVQATVDNSTSAITGLKSFKIKDGKLYEGIDYNSTDASTSGSVIGDASTSNVILNGIENTLKVVGDNSGNSLSNATINAYGTAVEFDNTSGGSLSLTNATVNGGLKEVTPPGGTTKEKVAVILGSSGADTLVLKNTVVNGNIDMKGGKNLIEAGEGTTVNGNITTEGGDDTFTSGNNVVINGDITLGDGTNANKIVLGNKVYINGDISTGTSKGVDFTGGSEIYLNGEVVFTDKEDTFTLGEKSVINKDIDMGAENDTLTIGAGSIVNGKLDGGTGDDTLTFGKNSGVSPASITEDNTEDSINISHDISGFEDINVGTKVTFASDLTITGTSNIALEKDGVLLLTLDKTTLGIDGKMTGHALYNLGSTTSVSSTGGRLLLDLDGATAEQIITFGDTNLEESIVPGDNETLDITSKVHTIKAGATPNEMIVVLRWTIPEILKYKGLNGVYHGIGSVNDLIGNFNIKSDEQLVTFIEYLNNIYAGSPYSYSSELSRKSAGMFRDIVVDNIFRPEKDKWMIYGGLTHVDGGTKDTYYGKGYYTYDIGSSDMDADTKITGAYMLGEYGVSDTLSSGVVIGGNKLKSDLSNGSKVDGSALYLGAYAKKYVGNLKVTAGAGFQYGDYDADRLAVNKVASDETKAVMKYSDNYNDITYDIYLNGRYSHQVGDNLFLEPYATLSYTYVDQDGANEGNKTLAIETDSKSFDYTVGKVGVDLKKVIPHEKGKSTLTAGVSYTKILDGADEEHITGRFKGGSDFDILVAHKNEHSIGLNAKYALELENGVIFDVKGTYSVERDSHNSSAKNKTKGEWIVGAGLGYKF